MVSVVEEFVSADRPTLFLFYENDILKATFCIPEARTDAVVWFLKKTDEKTFRLDNSNFSKLVSFGKMDTQVEKTMFLLMDSLYSPFVFSWSAGILLLLLFWKRSTTTNYSYNLWNKKTSYTVFCLYTLW